MDNYLKVLEPYVMKDTSVSTIPGKGEGKLLASTVAENETPWNSTATYAIGDRVALYSNHTVYEATQVSTNKNPLTYSSGSTPSWVVVGATNRWAAFDLSGGTYSTSQTPDTTMEFFFKADSVTSMAFQDISASSILLEIMDSSNTILYTKTVVLTDAAPIANWYDYFTTDISIQPQVFIEDIPSYVGCTYRILITNGGAVSLSNFIFGKVTNLGSPQYGVTGSILDYSKKDVDAFGKVNLVKRAFSKRADIKLHLPTGMTNGTYNTLVKLRATPCYWTFTTGGFDQLSIFGFYRDFSVEIAYPSYSICSLQIEGLT